MQSFVAAAGRRRRANADAVSSSRCSLRVDVSRYRLTLSRVTMYRAAVRCDPAWAGMTDAQVTALTLAVFAGMFGGANFNGAVSDRFGRRPGVLSGLRAGSGSGPVFVSTLYIALCFSMLTGWGRAALAICALFGVLSGLAPSLPWLVAARFGVGFGVGGSPAAIALYTEVLPIASRGRQLLYQSIFFSLGAITAALLATGLAPRQWRMFLLAMALPSLAGFAACWRWLPESPRFLLANGRLAEAAAALQAASRANGRGTLPSSQPAPLLLLSDTTESNSSGWMAVLWTRTTGLLCLLFFCMAVLYYGIGILTVTLEESRAVDPCDFSPRVHRNIMLANASELVGLLVSSMLLDRVGRRATVAGMFFACGLALYLYGSLGTRGSFSPFIAAASLCGMRACALGFNQSLWVYAAEAFPTRLRVCCLRVGFCGLGG
jgi:putative MFS transporter